MKEIFKTLKHQNIKTLKQTLIDFDSCGVPLHPGAGKVHPRVGERRGEPLGEVGKGWVVVGRALLLMEGERGLVVDGQGAFLGH